MDQREKHKPFNSAK